MWPESTIFAVRTDGGILRRDLNTMQGTRSKQIIRTSVLGIVANVLLAAFKAVVGAVAGSIAIVMDAVNNLTDALSSVITIIGTKLSERPPDRQHPFGHGRVEYFSAMAIALIVLAAGIASLIESVKKIIHPVVPTYTSATLAVVIIAIIVKLLLGRYVKRQGDQLKSDALRASGADALSDAAVTLATLVSAILLLLCHVNLDGIFGTLISLVIIKTGIEMLGAPVSHLLGKSASRDLVAAIRQRVIQQQGVEGVYDIILNYYGPSTIIGSLNISVPDTMTAREIHGLSRAISTDLMKTYGMVVNVGVYATCTGKMGQLQARVMRAALACPHVVQAHAFYVFEEKHAITLDIVHDDEITDDDAYATDIAAELQRQFPDYDFQILIDHNYTA